MLGREEKRGQSSSFTKVSESPQEERKNIFSADKLASFKGEEKVQQKNIVLKGLEKVNTNNKLVWKLNSFEVKRNLYGYKGRLEWCQSSKDIKIIIKLNFSHSFFLLANSLVEGDLIVELQELNLELTPNQKKDLQQKLQNIISDCIEAIQRRNYSQQSKKQSECLKMFLIQAGTQFHRRASQFKRRQTIDKVDKKGSSKRYMLYPAPVCFSWNPLGSICITQNKYPANKKPFIGEANAVKKYFDVSRNQSSLENVLRQNQNGIELGKEEPQQSIYDWKIQDEVNLIIFNRERSFKKDDKYYASRSKSDLSQQTKREDQKKDEDSTILGYLNRIQSPKLRKVYQKYFGGNEKRVSQFHRHDKLRVYDIRSFNRDYQDQITYLLQKISLNSQKSSIIQTVFQNQLSAHIALLSGPIDKMRYDILANFIRRKMSDSKLAFGLFLKLYILQNQFLGKQLQQYFKMLYRMLGRKPHYQLYFLGSYNHFDHIKTEMLFMDILQRIVSGQNQQNSNEITISSKLNLRTRTKFKLPRFVFEGVVSENEKNNYLMNLFPLLIVKDREMQKFQFKQIKRIISANSKLSQFITKINQIINRYYKGETAYLKSLIYQYNKFKEEDCNQDAFGLQPRRFFLLHCECSKIIKIYQPLSKQQIDNCQRCKMKLFNQSQ